MRERFFRLAARPGTLRFIILFASLWLAWGGARLTPSALACGTCDEGPSTDRLAPPEMPEHPTRADIGRDVYYYHCMPCHGDRGQGLTTEWRQVWVEDHQNCWARGCHAGHEGDAGFPIPHDVPAVSGSSEALARYTSADALFDFLLQNHPPQRPGALSADECWALTAFLFQENGRLLEGSASRSGLSVSIAAIATLGLLLGARRANILHSTP
jgi:hypothetical protein